MSIGRPKKPEDQKQDKRILLGMTGFELRAFKKCAEQAHLSTSAWIRTRLVEAAEKELEGPKMDPPVEAETEVEGEPEE